VAKGNLRRLIPAIEREIREAAGRAERGAIERQLRQAQKMEAIGQLTGGIAHDFNNILCGLVGYLELVEDRVQDDPETRGMVAETTAAAMRAAELTRRLLTFARQQPLEPRALGVERAGFRDDLAPAAARSARRSSSMCRRRPISGRRSPRPRSSRMRC